MTTGRKIGVGVKQLENETNVQGIIFSQFLVTGRKHILH
jgi:hypothetical protein